VHLKFQLILSGNIFIFSEVRCFSCDCTWYC